MVKRLLLILQTRYWVARDIFKGWRLLLTIIGGGYSLVGFVRNEFLPNTPILKDITPLLPNWVWILIILGLLFMLTFEGSYKLVRKTKDNYVDNYRYEHGRLPILPKELEELFNGYQSGQPISKGMEAITPSAQCWNYRLSPKNKKIWRDVVSWLGKDPDDIIWHMQQMLPKDPRDIRSPKWIPPEQH